MAKQGAETNIKAQLSRELGLGQAVGIGIGAVIGAGIFVVTGVAAATAGPAMLLSLLLAGFAATCNGLSSAQLAASYPQAGGTYEYGYQVLSPLAGFSAGWMFLASKLAAGGVVALGFGHYFNQLFPQVDAKLAALAAVVLLAMANLFGIRKAGTLNLVIVSLTVLTLIYFIISGLPRLDSANLVPFMPHGWGSVAQATALMFFAFTGYARIATLGEEVRDPQKTIPKAIIITLSVTVVLYLLIVLTAIGGVGAGVLGATNSPLLEAAKAFNTPGLVTLLGIGATTAMLGVLLSQILGISRMFFAMARKDDLPRWFGTVSERTKIPIVGVLVTAGVMILLIFTGTIPQVTATASFTILLYYSIANISAWKQPPDQRRFPKWIHTAGLISCLLMAFSLPWQVILTGLILLAVGHVIRLVVRGYYRKTSR